MGLAQRGAAVRASRDEDALSAGEKALKINPDWPKLIASRPDTSRKKDGQKKPRNRYALRWSWARNRGR